MKKLFVIIGVILIIFTSNSCEKEEECTDADGNSYRTVIIGTQVWMAENLKTTKFNDGTDIPLATDEGAWVDLTSPGYCWYPNGETNYKDDYGGLYNWYAVSSANNGNKNVCPTGWHVPTDAEWTSLQDYLITNGYNYDSTTTDNKIAKSLASSSGWTSSTITGDVGNTDYPAIRNATGFTALPGGYRVVYIMEPIFHELYAQFWHVGNASYWWSVSEYDQSLAWTRAMSYNSSKISRNISNKKNGFSVRCLKD